MSNPHRYNTGHAWSIWCYFDAKAPQREQAAAPPPQLQDPETAIAYLWGIIQQLKAVVETQADALQRPITINVKMAPDDEARA